MTGLSEKRLQLVILHFLFYGGFLLLRSLFEGDLSGFAPILALFLIWISVIDVERLEIPDIASAALFAVGLVVCYLHQLDLLTRLTEAALWMGLFWGVGTGYAKWRDWHGLGFGDVKLIAGLTVWLGFTDTTKAVFAAALSGILVILFSGRMQTRSFSDIGQTAVAFAPFLCLSAWVMWLF